MALAATALQQPDVGLNKKKEKSWERWTRHERQRRRRTKYLRLCHLVSVEVREAFEPDEAGQFRGIVLSLLRPRAISSRLVKEGEGQGGGGVIYIYVCVLCAGRSPGWSFSYQL